MTTLYEERYVPMKETVGWDEQLKRPDYWLQCQILEYKTNRIISIGYGRGKTWHDAKQEALLYAMEQLEKHAKYGELKCLTDQFSFEFNDESERGD